MDWSPHYLYGRFFGHDRAAVDRFLAEVDFYNWNHQLDQGRPFAEVIAETSRRFPAHRALIEIFEERWEETLAGPIQPSVEILRALKAAGRPLYALTNWPAGKFQPVRRRYEFFDFFADIVVSGEVGLAKPDSRIFAVLLERIGRKAADCLFVDDSPPNIAAAARLGFQTIHFQTPAQLRMELGIRGLL